MALKEKEPYEFLFNSFSITKRHIARTIAE